MAQLTIELPVEILQRLTEQAERQHLPLNEMAREAIAGYFEFLDDEDEIEDTPLEKIEADFRQAWHEAMTGQYRPLDDVLNDIRKRQHGD